MAPAPTLIRMPRQSGPKSKGIVKREYTPAKAIKRAERSYSKRRKVEVLLFIENHRIPIEKTTGSGHLLPPTPSQTLAGASVVEEGFRRPFLREVAEYFKISKSTIAYWWSQREKILGSR
ncbi:hypothetical protein F5B21DRAFT_462881 [Xylaria acuta]|nr:hypothetical protein F5B21DRAFT_462881 [Xylaria acuta]